MPITNTFELNGKRYDAITGRLLGGSLPDGSQPNRPVGSFNRTQPHRDTTIAKPIHVQHRGKSFDIQRNPSPHAKAHQPERSRTLMRQAVHKPDISTKRRLKPVVPTDFVAKKQSQGVVVTVKQSVSQPSPLRLEHARQVPRSQLIQRYGTAQSQQVRLVAAASAPVSVLQAPAVRPMPHPVQQQAPMPQTSPQSRPASNDIFEHALAVANSHAQAYSNTKRKTKRHSRLRQFLSIAASAAAILVIVGFVAYSNVADIQLRIAASQAGINATLPKWQPDGYKLGTLTAGPGSVTINFSNPSSSDSYTIAQAATNWDSSTLLNDYVYPNNNTYNTIQTNGSTIYTYGNNNATWVSGGIWYKLTSNGVLSNSEIVQIAASM